MKKIILDTDIGSDIDDAFALAYLLCRTDIEILGITTVSGSPELRAQVADKICSVYGKDIPVCVGCEKSLSGEVHQPRLTKAQTAVALSNNREDFENNAAEFMRSIIEKHPGEVTLVCIGQLTNIATLFSKYSHIPDLLNGMVIMGGRFASCDTQRWGETEWNIWCDIEASRIVYDRRVKNSIVIGGEQTCRFYCPPLPVKTAFAKISKLSAVSDCVNTNVKEVYFHDAIAIYAWLYPEEVVLKQGSISIEVSEDGNSAESVFNPSKQGSHFLVTDFSPEKFWENYKHIVKIDI